MKNFTSQRIPFANGAQVLHRWARMRWGELPTREEHQPAAILRGFDAHSAHPSQVWYNQALRCGRIVLGRAGKSFFRYSSNPTPDQKGIKTSISSLLIWDCALLPIPPPIKRGLKPPNQFVHISDIFLSIPPPIKRGLKFINCES